jgi:HNH endonuclease/Homing endonuclease associated repeat
MGRYEIDFLDEYTDEALLAKLRRIAALLPDRKPLTKAAYEALGARVAETTICRRLGGWQDALQKAGLDHLYIGQVVSKKMREQPIRKMSNDELISEMRRVHASCGKKWLRSEDFNLHSVTSEDAVRSRFGSFRKGLEAAGIPYAPNKQRLRTDEDCFENLAAVWIHYGRPPQYREMFRSPSAVQGKTYVTRWGTWRRSLKAFVDWANSEASSEPAPASSQPTAEVTPTAHKSRTEADCREVRPGLRFKVFMRDRFRCLACGRSPATHLNIELHADHIRSVADGGKTTLENLQTLCEDCNLGKGRTSIK